MTTKQNRHISALAKATLEITNTLYIESAAEVLSIKINDPDLLLKIQDIKYHAGSVELQSSHPEQYAKMSKQVEDISSLYLEKMCKLPTKALSDILFLHEYKRPQRASRTLEMIISELTRRELMDDSSQSDTNHQNGELDVERESKASSKKTSSKRYKTSVD